MAKLVAGLLPLSMMVAGLALLAQDRVVLSQPAAASQPASTRSVGTGRITGRVLNRGTAKAAVAVLILRQDGQLLQKVYSGADGRYLVDHLAPGTYAATVLDPDFLPFWKSAISVVAGSEVVLDIPLLSLAESLQVAWPPSPGQNVDDWKWVLRSGYPTRPLLRFQPVSASGTRQAAGDGAERALRGTLQFLAGNDGSGFGQDPGLSTFFDMAYARDGGEWIGLSGSAGWARDTPAASMRASWNRKTDAGTSSVSFTMRQVSLLPVDYRATGSSLPGASERSAISGTLGYKDSESLSENVQMQYGSLFDAMNFDGLLTRWSPFAKVTYTPAANESLTLAYNGASPDVLPFDGNQDYHASEQWLAIPQVSAGPEDKPVMEGGTHSELRWEQALGSRFRYETAVYYDDISNSALSLALVQSSPLAGELLQDPFSSRYFLSAGELTSPGVRGAVSVKLASDMELIAGYDYSGTLEAGSAELAADSAEALRRMLVTRRDGSYIVKLKSSLPWSHTQVISSYRWLPRDAVALPDPYDRGWSQAGPYLNLLIAQPIPSPYILQGQFQAIAEFDNLLAQGYLPVVSADGGLGYLFPSARAFRGGLNFIF